jgi:hypothetical protein
MKIALGVLLMIGLIIGGGYYMDIRKIQKEQAIAAAIAAEKAEAERIALNKKFETVINELLGEIQKNMAQYKTRRDLVAGLIQPENNPEPVYTLENYKFMAEVIPDLYAQMDRIMKIFEAAEKSIYALIEKESENSRQSIITAWGKIKTAQIANYTAYFTSEQDILGAYMDLMKFYAEKRGVSAYDPGARIIVFRDPADNARAEELRRIIDELNAMQKNSQ